MSQSTLMDRSCSTHHPPPSHTVSNRNMFQRMTPAYAKSVSIIPSVWLAPQSDQIQNAGFNTGQSVWLVDWRCMLSLCLCGMVSSCFHIKGIIQWSLQEAYCSIVNPCEYDCHINHMTSFTEQKQIYSMMKYAIEKKKLFPITLKIN